MSEKQKEAGNTVVECEEEKSSFLRFNPPPPTPGCLLLLQASSFSSSFSLGYSREGGAFLLMETMLSFDSAVWIPWMKSGVPIKAILHPFWLGLFHLFMPFNNCEISHLYSRTVEWTWAIRCSWLKTQFGGRKKSKHIREAFEGLFGFLVLILKILGEK